MVTQQMHCAQAIHDINHDEAARDVGDVACRPHDAMHQAHHTEHMDAHSIEDLVSESTGQSLRPVPTISDGVLVHTPFEQKLQCCVCYRFWPQRRGIADPAHGSAARWSFIAERDTTRQLCRNTLKEFWTRTIVWKRSLPRISGACDLQANLHALGVRP